MEKQLTKTNAGESVRFAGVVVSLGDREFIVPPLSIGSLDLHAELIALLRDIPESRSMEVMGKSAVVIHAAIVRNYPTITVEEVAERVDLVNFHEVINEIFGVSGLLARAAKRKNELPVELNRATQAAADNESKTSTSSSSSAT